MHKDENGLLQVQRISLKRVLYVLLAEKLKDHLGPDNSSGRRL